MRVSHNGSAKGAKGFLDEMPEGGVCSTLAPGIAAKYFTANLVTQQFEVRTAKAICARCPVRRECLERVVRGPDLQEGDYILRYGVVGGMTTAQIARIQAWEAYDNGRSPVLPKNKRVQEWGRLNKPPVLAPRDKPSKVTVADLSFEERVYAIFRDIKGQKYRNLNDAITDIARLHEADLMRRQGTLALGSNKLRPIDGRRKPRKKVNA